VLKPNQSQGQVLSGNPPPSANNTINTITGAKNLVAAMGDLNDFTLSANSAIGFRRIWSVWYWEL